MDASDLLTIFTLLSITLGVVGIIGMIVNAIRHRKKTVFFILFLIAIGFFIAAMALPVQDSDGKNPEKTNAKTTAIEETVKETEVITETMKESEVVTKKITESTVEIAETESELVTENATEEATETLIEQDMEPATEQVTELIQESTPETMEETEKKKVKFKITGDKVGKYGQVVVLNKGTEFEETEIMYYVPTGSYLVKNLDESRSVQLSIYSGGPEKNGEWEEFVMDDNCHPLVLMAGDIGELEIQEGQFIVMSDGSRGLEIGFIKQN